MVWHVFVGGCINGDPQLPYQRLQQPNLFLFYPRTLSFLFPFSFPLSFHTHINIHNYLCACHSFRPSFTTLLLAFPFHSFGSFAHGTIAKTIVVNTRVSSQCFDSTITFQLNFNFTKTTKTTYYGR